MGRKNQGNLFGTSSLRRCRELERVWAKRGRRHSIAGLALQTGELLLRRELPEASTVMSRLWRVPRAAGSRQLSVTLREECLRTEGGVSGALNGLESREARGIRGTLLLGGVSCRGDSQTRRWKVGGTARYHP